MEQHDGMPHPNRFRKPWRVRRRPSAAARRPHRAIAWSDWLAISLPTQDAAGTPRELLPANCPSVKSLHDDPIKVINMQKHAGGPLHLSLAARHPTNQSFPSFLGDFQSSSFPGHPVFFLFHLLSSSQAPLSLIPHPPNNREEPAQSIPGMPPSYPDARVVVTLRLAGFLIRPPPPSARRRNQGSDEVASVATNRAGITSWAPAAMAIERISSVADGILKSGAFPHCRSPPTAFRRACPILSHHLTQLDR